jgi:hypothetical protein
MGVSYGFRPSTQPWGRGWSPSGNWRRAPHTPPVPGATRSWTSPGRWAFMPGCLLKPILAVAQIVEGSVPSATLRGDANGDNYLVLAWRNFYGDFVQRRPGRRCASARSATLRRRMVENDGSICHTLITPKPRGL